jgi:hypothetical protein
MNRNNLNKNMKIKYLIYKDKLIKDLVVIHKSVMTKKENGIKRDKVIKIN